MVPVNIQKSLISTSIKIPSSFEALWDVRIVNKSLWTTCIASSALEKLKVGVDSALDLYIRSLLKIFVTKIIMCNTQIVNAISNI